MSVIGSCNQALDTGNNLSSRLSIRTFDQTLTLSPLLIHGKP